MATVTTLWRYDIERKSKYINFNVYTKQARITLYNDEGRELGVYDTLVNDEWTVEDKGLNFKRHNSPSICRGGLRRQINYNQLVNL